MNSVTSTGITGGDSKGETAPVVKPKISRQSRYSGLKAGNTIGVGRPKGLAAMVREQTGDGKLIVEKMMEYAFGKTQCPKLIRFKALEWLADRGFGKVQQNFSLTDEEGNPIWLTVVQRAREIAVAGRN